MKLLIACMAANVCFAATFFLGFWLVDIATPKRGIHDDSTIALIAIPSGIALCAAAFYVWWRVFDWISDKLKA